MDDRRLSWSAFGLEDAAPIEHLEQQYVEPPMHNNHTDVLGMEFDRFGSDLDVGNPIFSTRDNFPGDTSAEAMMSAGESTDAADMTSAIRDGDCREARCDSAVPSTSTDIDPSTFDSSHHQGYEGFTAAQWGALPAMQHTFDFHDNSEMPTSAPSYTASFQNQMPNPFALHEDLAFPSMPQDFSSGYDTDLREPWMSRDPSAEYDMSAMSGYDTGDVEEEVCYAQLLHRCLIDAPDYTMSLRQIYDWIKEHSQKAKDPTNKGWQNSVRHNLSMNAAFERVPAAQTQGVKKGSLWRLTSSAIVGGVISTTRYRKDPKRRANRNGLPALKRQISGAKGGQATRNAARRMQALQHANSDSRAAARYSHQHAHANGLRRHYGFEQTTHASNTSNPFNSPSPGMTPHEQQSLPTSPYFLNAGDYPGYNNTYSLPTSAPQTPYQTYHPQHQSTKHAMGDDQFGYVNVDMYGGIAATRDLDDFAPETPSPATEGGFASIDEGPEDDWQNSLASDLGF